MLERLCDRYLRQVVEYRGGEWMRHRLLVEEHSSLRASCLVRQRRHDGDLDENLAD